MYRPIRDYAIIGNLRSAVLISKDASIDWAPAPFIDSPSIFASILDEEKGGFWSIQPKEPYHATQKYIDGTNILVTRFETDNGIVQVTDFIPVEKEKASIPDEEDTTFRIHRKIHAVKGSHTLKMVFKPRFNYARGKTKLSYQDGGIAVQNGNMHGALAGGSSFEIHDDEAVADVFIKEDESEYFVFRYNAGKIPLTNNDKIHHEEELQETFAFWRSWTHQCDDSTCPAEGKWGDMITRSELLLKILFFEPSGTVAAAATTSLPEAIGGVRNWDYRYTWIRDSSFIFESFLKLGHTTEAEQYLTWLISKCFGDGATFEPMQIMYPLRDGVSLDEEILPHLEGYRDSRPVRIGNDAYRQKQWDIYGNILDLIWRLYEVKTDPPSSALWNLVKSIGNYIVEVWREPDEGLWEVRGGKEHFTYSKVMCWTALDRVEKIARKYHHRGHRQKWKIEKELIGEEIMKRSWNSELGSFVQSFDSKNLDASLLLLSTTGFIDGKDPKMLSTIDAIKAGLQKSDIYLKRYTSYDGLPGNEGAFLLATFWMIDALALAGRDQEAKEIFEKMLTRSNHIGLYAEEIDPNNGDFLGNFPQAYTHLGLINSAFVLSSLPKEEKFKEEYSDTPIATSIPYPAEPEDAASLQDVP